MKIAKPALFIVTIAAFLIALVLVLKAPRVNECISTVGVPCPVDQR